MDVSVQGFVAGVERLGVHSFVLLRHGETVAEGWWHPYEPERPQTLYSLSKSFTSTAVGLAVADGLLSVDDLVADLLPGHNRDLRGMRVRHLLTMTTGHDTDAAPLMAEDPGGDWVRGFLGVPVVHEPGTRFVYNSGATYALSAIVQRLTGETLLDYLRPRLFEPLGFGPAAWDTCPRGISFGGWGLRLRTADLARFGELYLRGGRWQGRQLVPAAWVEAATAAQVPNGGPDPDESPDWQQGYGYQFWRCRHGAFRGDGAFGQFVVVMPAQDQVLAVTAGASDMQAVLDAVWAHLLDAAPAPSASPRLEGLRIPALTDTAEPGADLPGREFRVAEPVAPPQRGGRPPIDQPSRIEGFAVVRAPHGWLVRLDDEHGVHRFTCEPGRWHASTMATSDGEVHPIATTGAWRGPGTFELRVCHTAEPCTRTYTAQFDATGVTIAAEDSVGFDFTAHPPVRAEAVSG
ncbi:beta-lactamase family protein [Dactylosporangium sp. NBC_01737]|uniref:serine hydrolase domain-containing protein n=1 Tax=Dactylosporangium sp. NBC_01737 TaxID=2975959 RepID=UPI002E10E207|nr:beta-lactamase family protein [Dactylosporangium sp. NBC_01737]